MPQDSHIPFYHTTIRRKLQEVFKIFLRKLCGVKFPSKCNSKCCCCGCLDNLRICLLADGSTCPCRPLRGGLPSLPLANPAFSFLFSPHPPAPALTFLFFPHPPRPLPLRGWGSPNVYFAGGSAPGTPALNRLRHLQTLPNRYPAHGSLRFGAKPKEPPFHGQCRQPRRGGIGGDGTIRRKRRRRLRWSFPPGQGEQVPLGFSPPPGTTAARLAGDQPGKPPAGFMFEKVCKCRRRLNAGDARGGAPCMK